MKKKELLALPLPPAPDIDLRTIAPIIKIEKRSYGKYEVENITKPYTARIIEQSGEQYLELIVYDHTLKPEHRHFHDEKKKQWVGWNYKDNKKTEAGLAHALWYHYYTGNDTTYLPIGDANEVIDSVVKLPEHKNGLDRLVDHHRNIKKERLEEKNQKIIQRMEEDMREIRPLPQKVYQWIKGTLMKASRYIVYEYNGKKTTTGYCSHCQQTVTVSAPRHREKGTCPSCRSTITCLASGKTSSECDNGSFAYFQSTKEGFVVRYFNVTLRHDKQRGVTTTLSTETSVHETFRVFHSGLWQGQSMVSRKAYEYGNFKQCGKMCFYEVETDRATYASVGAVYGGNINDVLRKQVKNKHLDFSLPCRHLKNVEVGKMIEAYIQKPHVEQLIKMKLYNLTKAVISGYGIKESEKGIKKWLGIGKEDIPILQKLNPTQKELTLYKFVKQKSGGKADLKVYDRLRKEDSYYFHNNLLQCTGYMTLHKLLKYADTQKNSEQVKKEKLEGFMSSYKDYLRFSEVLGRDMQSSFVLWPKDLHTAHDSVSKELQEKEKEGGEELFQNIVERVKRFEDANKSFLIRAPKSMKEIREEGDALHHCVGNYAKRMARGDTYILFVRKKESPEQPYYTVELNPRDLEIIQYRGYKNNTGAGNGVDPKVTAFIENWNKRIKQKYLYADMPAMAYGA